MYFSQKVLRPLFAGVEESQGKYSSHQIDAIKGIEAVKAAAAENVFRDMMLNEFLSVSQKIFRSSFIVMTYDSVLQTIGMLSTAIFLWVGANQVMSGALSIGGFVAFSSLTAMAYGGILRTLGVWDNMQLATVLLNRLNDIFEQEPEQGRDRSRLAPVHSLEGRIELRGVSFKYGGPEAPNILTNITLDLAPGRMVAFVGPQRLREDDVDQAHRRPARADRRHYSVRSHRPEDAQLSRRPPAYRNGPAGEPHL